MPEYKNECFVTTSIGCLDLILGASGIMLGLAKSNAVLTLAGTFVTAVGGWAIGYVLGFVDGYVPTKKES